MRLSPAGLLLQAAVMLLLLAGSCHGLTSEERGELARKFKYYHESVRPTDRFNLVQNANGTFFALNCELEILQTRSDVDDDKRFHVDLQLIVHYNDDRLFLRELPDVLHIPDEFRAWTPTIELADALGGVSSGGAAGTPGGAGIAAAGDLASSASAIFTVQKSTFLDPKTGQVTVFHRITGSVNCLADAWKYPFERFACKVEFLTEQGQLYYITLSGLCLDFSNNTLDERLFLRVVRDLRIDAQRRHVIYFIEEWPNLALWLEFSREWLFALIDVYLPSLLIFSVALFAQWKRRKVQVLVTIGSILCIVLIKNAQDDSLLRRMGSRLYRNHYQAHGSVTLQDVWLMGLLIHLICILTIDLMLPSRRIVYAPPSPPPGVPSSLSPSSSTRDSPPTKISHGSLASLESRRPLFTRGDGSPAKRRRAAMPYISSRQRLYNAAAASSRRRGNASYLQRHASAAQIPNGHASSGADSRQVCFQSSPYLFPLESAAPAAEADTNDNASISSLGGGAQRSQETIFAAEIDADPDLHDIPPSRMFRPVGGKLEPIYIDATAYQKRDRIWSLRDEDSTAGIVNASYASDAGELRDDLPARRRGVAGLSDAQIRHIIQQQQQKEYQQSQKSPVRSTLRTSPTVHYRHVVVENQVVPQQQLEQQAELSPYVVMRRADFMKDNNNNRNAYIYHNNSKMFNPNNISEFIAQHNENVLLQQKQQLLMRRQQSEQQNYRPREQQNGYDSPNYINQKQRQLRSTVINGSVTSLQSNMPLQYSAVGEKDKSDTFYVMNPRMRTTTLCASSPNVRVSPPQPPVAAAAYRYVRDAHGAIHCVAIPNTAATTAERNQLPYATSIPALTGGGTRPPPPPPRHRSATRLTFYGQANEVVTQAQAADDADLDGEEEDDCEDEKCDSPRRQVEAYCPASRGRVLRITMGRKKRRALYGIIAGFCTFVVCYMALVAYAIFS